MNDKKRTTVYISTSLHTFLRSNNINLSEEIESYVMATYSGLHLTKQKLHNINKKKAEIENKLEISTKNLRNVWDLFNDQEKKYITESKFLLNEGRVNMRGRYNRFVKQYKDVSLIVFNDLLENYEDLQVE